MPGGKRDVSLASRGLLTSRSSPKAALTGTRPTAHRTTSSITRSSALPSGPRAGSFTSSKSTPACRATAAEAAVALQAGVDLLDVKEPARGPLGKADERVIEEVVRCAVGRVPVSAALGELRDVSKPREASDTSRLPPGITYGKLGLAGCGCWPDWPKRWAAALERLPGGVTPVAVAYADWRS